MVKTISYWRLFFSFVSSQTLQGWIPIREMKYLRWTSNNITITEPGSVSWKNRLFVEFEFDDIRIATALVLSWMHLKFRKIKNQDRHTDLPSRMFGIKVSSVWYFYCLRFPLQFYGSHYLLTIGLCSPFERNVSYYLPYMGFISAITKILVWS